MNPLAPTLQLLVGIAACASSVIFIKASTTPPVLLAGLRLLVATCVLAWPFYRDLRRYREHYGWPQLRRTLVPGSLLAAHFVSWIAGARMTPAVNSSLIVNMVPLATPPLLLILVRERPSAREWLGTGLAMAGVAVMVGGDYHFAPANVAGDAVCFGAMLLFSVYLVLAKRNRDFPSLWLYLVPLYAFAGLLCLTVSPLFLPAESALVFSPREIALIIGLGIIPTVIGHSSLNHAMKHLRGQFVGIINLGQPFFAGVFAFFLLGEVPAWFFYPASLLILLGAALALRTREAETPEPEQAARGRGAPPSSSQDSAG